MGMFGCGWQRQEVLTVDGEKYKWYVILCRWCLLLTVSVCLRFFDFYCVEVLPLLGVNDAVLLIFCWDHPDNSLEVLPTWNDSEQKTAAGILLIFGQLNITGNSKDLSKAGKEPIMSHKPSNFRLQNLQSFGSMLVLWGVWVTLSI